MSLRVLLQGKRICVCAGAGGVGKTTVSAALAAGMATEGLRVAVVTIDPARRLATSLGIPELGNAERRVEPERLAAAGLGGDGELWAMTLDAKRTFDELIERRAPDARTRDAVLSNRIYQELSAAVAGSQEYMAMEKIYELHEDGRYDLLVLDTPPSRNALDFLDAPERLARFIDSRSLQFFLAPGRRGLRLMGRGTGLLFGALKRVTGVDLLQDLSEFFQSFGQMAEGFSERATRVRELLTAASTRFLLVTSPRSESIEEAEFFRRRLAEDGMPFGGAVVNRMHRLATADGNARGEILTGDPEQELERLVGERLAGRVARNFHDHQRLARHDHESVERLRGRLGAEEPLVLIPELDDDVHDLRGLARINEHLFS
ncbi:MAG TPA: ArsA-related P-loop ATPase [Thermoleophilaceae bacterium]|nr:ArsA-related P-loop ATPase [Thermoleophilaceae bacterium]